MPALLPALALACVLTLAWSTSDWSNLSALRLPDTDDAMRLQQVRDWIGGQGFGDLHQYRLGGGLLMHWSRIGDLMPAAIIVSLAPFTGQPHAELVAVVAWPLLQFSTFLALVAGVARRLAPAAAGTALVLAALAWPTTTLFMPGRIDHHGLQIILVLVQLRALTARPGYAAGIAAAVAVAVGAAIGLETLPFACVTGAIIVLGWWRQQHGAAKRQRGFGIALALTLPALLPIAGHGGVCDTVQPLALPAVVAALAMTALTFGRPRLLALIAAGAVTVGAAFLTARGCLSGPYGNVDPLVARLWLAHVEEAQPLFAAPFANALGYAGLLLVGTLAGALLAWRRRGGWMIVLAYQIASVGLTLSQLRGAYLGAALAAIPIAALIVEARSGGRLIRVLALWLAGAGLVYPIVAGAFSPKPSGPAAPSCTSPQALARLRALPPGRIIAPIDFGAFAITATRHGAIAAAYHRNDAGNAAMYRFFLGPREQAERIARQWQASYVALCPGAFTETGTPPPDSIAAGARPAWLVPIGGTDDVPTLFTIAPAR